MVENHQQKYERPSPDALVVHLRLGDVMGDKKKKPAKKYRVSREVYSNLQLESLPPLRKSTIVTALHFGANPLNNKYFYSEVAKERSFEILELVTNQLKAKGLEVSYKSSENIDADICFMAGSSYFLKSLSGLSCIVADCMGEDVIVWGL